MESKTETPVFVYGTLKPGGYYHDTYCGGFQFDLFEGQVKGQLYSFPSLGYPGATEHDTQSIQGVLLVFKHPEREVLSKLDILEGYDPTRPTDQNEYYRKQVPVFDTQDQLICDAAWCYFMEPSKVDALNGVLIPDSYWPV